MLTALTCVLPCRAVVAVYLAEHINTYLAQHWQAFATQPYFDKNGIFVSTIYSAPLLFTMLVILVRAQLLVHAASLWRATLHSPVWCWWRWHMWCASGGVEEGHWNCMALPGGIAPWTTLAVPVALA